MTLTKVAPIHQEHRDARSEHHMWLEDIDGWRSEHRRAAAMLAQVQTALLEHDAALEAHAATIRLHEVEIDRHERALASHERGVPEADPEKLAEVHKAQLDKHAHARDAHQRIKSYHHLVTTEIAALLKKLHSAM
jgi:hypothetical protein